MNFNFELVYKLENDANFYIGGVLTPDNKDNDDFSLIKESIEELIKEGYSVGDYIELHDDKLVFFNISLTMLHNTLKSLSKACSFKLHQPTQNGCQFKPETCKPLFQMEISRLFRGWCS